ncbi:Transcriptional regulator, LysR family [Granulibacter bethesdensis]|uniref:Transcriptional regulator, LysR family n=2 Tax=Granulibacter bethesdensis TaxID=364410 RepID=Q0BR13_GRABC|nr:Transcriptional regulator, LysR family [Granulibacter bethesdensis CGDNIH1]APG30740.1 Transcriptional regulator, LysR family [Granulibacter bethesdensis]APH52598.1 Transcriptional regulator, LysR family [Granulibacter bethesdensis]APH65287.1 Transcriptional regulator, LysR family [Granulibacter bethesdensis]
MLDVLRAMRVFLRVAELGSFSAAARGINMSQPMISRQIGMLEDHFGTQLVQRSTRHLHLTEEGEALREHARRIIDQLEAAEEAIGRGARPPSGRVRLSSPTAFGLYLSGQMAAFHQLYPDIDIALRLSDETVNLIEDGLDLALYVGGVPETSMIVRKIGSARRLLVAAPCYMDGRAEPSSPAQLKDFDCLTYAGPGSDTAWAFITGGVSSPLPVHSWFSSSSSEATRRAALAGAGIAALPHYMVEQDLQEGRLIELLPQDRMEPLAVFVAYASTRHLAPRCRVLIDFIARTFKNAPGTI